MWGANKWTDGMFRKYKWIIIILITINILLRWYNGYYQ